jgi:prepilin-type N-terminal cleavage/methylation domain-containing protein
MWSRIPSSPRRGVSLTEILIGIAILGIGVISLATLFPLGLLRLRRAVNDTRSTYLARSAMAETRVRHLIAPPYGPLANVFRADGLLQNGEPGPAAFIPLSGPGIPVIIDPLGVLKSTTLSGADYPSDAAKRVGLFAGVSSGIPRFRGNIVALTLAEQVFSSADDLEYYETSRAVPLQANTGSGPQYLLPTNGLPFVPGTMYRQSRYSWWILARKVNAGQRPTAASDLRSNDDDNADGVTNGSDSPDIVDASLGIDSDEQNFPGPDGRYGRAGTLADANNNTIHDDAEDDLPAGPFAVSIAVFHNRDFDESLQSSTGAASERVMPFIFPVGIDGIANTADDAPPNVLRIPITGNVEPQISRESYVLDATYIPVAGGPRHAYWYRVLSAERTIDRSIDGSPVLGLRVTLEGEVRAQNTTIPLSITVLDAINGNSTVKANALGVGSLVAPKGVVAVFEKEIP